MKHLLLKTIALLIVLFSNTLLYAQRFEAVNEDGVTIYYRIYSSTEKTCFVSYKGVYEGQYNNVYSGAVKIPETVTYNSEEYKVSRIGNSAFSNCSGLTSVTIPNSVTVISSSAFAGCISMQKVIVKDISSWCNIYFENISSNPLYFAHHLYSDENTEITNLVIPNSVTRIGKYAFSGCSGLCFMTIPNSITSIEDNAFSGCTGLTSIEIPNSVTSFGASTFSGCTGLKKVIVKDIASWCGLSFANSNDNPLYFAHHLYSDENTEITNLVIPNSVTRIGKYAFYGCSGLNSVTIPNSVTSIGNNAFQGCSNITNLAINAPIIGNSLFKGLTSIKTIIIGKDVKSILNEAFCGCTGINDITSEITDVFVTGTNAFLGCENATLHVPAGTYVAYSGRADWNRIIHIVEREEDFKMTLACNTMGSVLINDETSYTNKIGDVEVKEDEENMFVFTPNAHCELKQVILNGLDVTTSVINNKLTATIPAKSQMNVVFWKESPDMNGDGKTDISDVVYLVNLILGQ